MLNINVQEMQFADGERRLILRAKAKDTVTRRVFNYNTHQERQHADSAHVAASLYISLIHTGKLVLVEGDFSKLLNAYQHGVVVLTQGAGSEVMQVILQADGELQAISADGKTYALDFGGCGRYRFVPPSIASPVLPVYQQFEGTMGECNRCGNPRAKYSCDQCRR